MAAACVGGEVDGYLHMAGGRVVDGLHDSEGVGVAQIGHDTHLELVFGLRLLEVHPQLEVLHVAGILGHGVDAALVEEEGVVAAVGVGGGVVNHGLVLVGHGDILLGEGPAVGLHACLGGGGGGVGVEVVGVGEVVGGDGGAGWAEAEHQVVDVVDAVVTGLA